MKDGIDQKIEKPVDQWSQLTYPESGISTLRVGQVNFVSSFLFC
jgi:hypothetical protein